MNRLPLFVVMPFFACQTYQFEPVQPLTVAVTTGEPRELRPVLKPNVMLAVDRSSSMTTPIDRACASASCPTRLSELKQAVATFTTLAAESARLGLTLFPSPTPPANTSGTEALCAPATSLQVPLPRGSRQDDPQAAMDNRLTAQAVNRAVQAIVAEGGTPTGGTLAFLRSEPTLNADDYRSDFVVLLTDGLPNCNPDNPIDFVQAPQACRCTTTSGQCGTPDLRRRGCLDTDGTVAEVEKLAKAGIRTVVIGFGAETQGSDARLVLERLASAGQVPRRCRQDADCGPQDRCTLAGDLGTCGRAAWQAGTRAELEKVLEAVLAGLVPVDCSAELPALPLSDGTSGISVLLDGKPLPSSAWSRSGNLITLERATCEAHFGATLQVRVVTAL